MFYRLCLRTPDFEWLQIDHKSVKVCHASLVKFSYLSKFHVNIIPGYGVITIFVYKGLTRNPEIGNITV